MEIGLFQLENLATTPARFRLLDLRLQMEAVDPLIDRVLKLGIPVAAADVVKLVRGENLPPEIPLVLICETGERSREAAVALEGAGYQQIYVVGGGVAGLLSEL